MRNTETTKPYAESKGVQARKREEYNPNFSNVHIGQQWFGAYRRASFIKALGMAPKKSGSSSRSAQEKSILRCCAIDDDSQTQILTLVEIYNERLPKEKCKRPLKYDNLIATILVRYLAENDHLRTTKRSFFKKLGIIASSYKQIPISFYKEKLSGIKSSDGFYLDVTVKRLRDIADEKFASIVSDVLDRLEQSGIIAVKKYPIIVTPDGNHERHTPLPEADSLQLSVDDATKMIEDAKTYAIAEVHKSVNSGSFAEHNRKQNIQIKNERDVISNYKYDDFQSYVNDYVKKHYGWKYIYEGLEISLGAKTSQIQSIVLPLSETEAKQKLTALIVQGYEKSTTKKYNNRANAYREEYTKIFDFFQSDPTAKELMEVDIYTEEDIKKSCHTYQYPEGFLSVRDMFSKYEIEQHETEQEELQKWLRTHGKSGKREP